MGVTYFLPATIRSAPRAVELQLTGRLQLESSSQRFVSSRFTYWRPLTLTAVNNLPHYSAFDGCLRSDQILFPELPFSESRMPDWYLHVADEPSPQNVGEKIGIGVEPMCEIALYRIADGFRLRHSCTGEFDITANGSTIVWYPLASAKPEMARIDVLGRVLSVALHMTGVLTLHGSAVAFGKSGAAFLAPKHHGKSTLAAALVRAGARMLSDDSVAVDLRVPATMRFGVPSMRLCGDSAQRLIDAETPQRIGIDGKHIVDHKSAESMTAAGVALSAIYLLHPIVPGGHDAPASRTKLPVSQAAISILAHAKIGTLLGKGEASVTFEMAASLARLVPVYRLDIVRDFDEIENVVDSIMAWHDETVPTGR
jgi:hypothetical protein